MKVEFVGWVKSDPEFALRDAYREAIFALEDGSQFQVFLDSYSFRWPASDAAVMRHLKRHIADEVKRHLIKRKIVETLGEPGTTLEVDISEDDE